MRYKGLKELEEYREILIMQLKDEQFIKSSSKIAYEQNVQKLVETLLEIKECHKKIKRFQCEYRWLSNFWKCEVKYKDMTFPSNENFYQAMKTKDKNKRLEFITMTPAEAKAEGKWIETSHMFRTDWLDVKEDVMLYGLREKFKEQYLKERLLETGDLIIEEGNSWNDVFWGICSKTGEGENRLGKLLMKLRSEIIKKNK